MDARARRRPPSELRPDSRCRRYRRARPADGQGQRIWPRPPGGRTVPRASESVGLRRRHRAGGTRGSRLGSRVPCGRVLSGPAGFDRPRDLRGPAVICVEPRNAGPNRPGCACRLSCGVDSRRHRHGHGAQRLRLAHGSRVDPRPGDPPAITFGGSGVTPISTRRTKTRRRSSSSGVV